ncbi:hypothetical protein PFISCL1PPCAC_15198 [Pristionchus fissidentatus]|uniref:Uncharacterized protein n=1 Tax=Pristionchus fissidentatus TaxID=1538716 RepID=A0AAV5VZI2_9BILA|nr:hypothetical protein PFISCL1PPCAC_15198 [Pristionchus fissidentatus]
MSVLSEKDNLIRETHRTKLSLTLLDEEIRRLQPSLKKYENVFVHPAARPVQKETVSANSLTEKTKSIKQETAKMKDTERDLQILNNRASTLFSEVESKVQRRDSLFSEIEQATSKMNSLTISSPRFEDDVIKVKGAACKNSVQISSIARDLQEKMKMKLTRLAVVQKSISELDRAINIKQQRAKILKNRKDEVTRKIKLDDLAMRKSSLGELTNKVNHLKEFIATATKDEGQLMETLTSSITESEIQKKRLAELAQQMEEANARNAETERVLEQKQMELFASKSKLEQLKLKKDILSKNHESAMSAIKEKNDPVMEGVKKKTESKRVELEKLKKRINNREECLRLRKELELEGVVEVLDLTEEMAGINREIEEAHSEITKFRGEAEHYRIVAVSFNIEADELHAADKQKKDEETKLVIEKDAAANQCEMEVYTLKKKLDDEKTERETRLAMETRRLLEKAKEDKERKEKEDKKKMEREKEKIRKAKEDEEKKKARKAKDEEEKKRRRKEEEEKRRKIEEEEKKRKKEADQKKARQAEEEEKKRKREEAKRVINVVHKKEASDAIVACVQQRQMDMQASAAVPFASNGGHPLRAPPPPPMNFRVRSVQKKPMYIFDDDSSEDDDDDMSDFLMDERRVMPKVPEKYAGSPPRVERHKTPVNPFDLSFTDVQSSTPKHEAQNPSPVFELSFNDVVTSTPQISKGSKPTKKVPRGRGKKRTK